LPLLSRFIAVASAIFETRRCGRRRVSIYIAPKGVADLSRERAVVRGRKLADSTSHGGVDVSYKPGGG
jgi:hypothetical protein